MIDVRAKVHDKFSVEFKTSFLTRRKLKDNDFQAFMWIFVPNSLDINANTYTKESFYQDIKSNIRLKTPQFLFHEIAAEGSEPLEHLSRAFHSFASNPTRTAVREYEYQIKMYSAISHSAARDSSRYIMSSKRTTADVLALTQQFVESSQQVLKAYRSLRTVVSQPTVEDSLLRFYCYGDEYLTYTMAYYGVRLLNNLLNRRSADASVLAPAIEALRSQLSEEAQYQEQMGYAHIADGNVSSRQGGEVVYRQSVLKKYVDSDLYLNVPKKKDGKVVEQLYFSIAAGLAMMFATVVSFHFQQKYGNFTLPFFVILVISYMIKDRIKELSRFYFAHRIGTRFFDHKATILVKDEKIGTLKEGMDFYALQNIPEDVRRVRYSKRMMDIENRLSDEKAILYRMALHINRERLNRVSVYETAGINDIIRLNVNSLLKKMDNPKVNMMVLDSEGQLCNVACDKLYYVNIVLQLRYEGTTTFRRYRISLSRNGIEGFCQVD